MDLKENIERILKIVEKGNGYGEKVRLVAATKTQTAEKINEAIRLGVSAIGENHAQEFRDKTPLLLPCEKHFIGRLQKNKLKYVVGKADLIHSCDDVALLEEIEKRSALLGVRTDLLIEVNLTGEAQKGGVSETFAPFLFEKAQKSEWICPKGIMVMLKKGTEKEMATIADRGRALFERLKAEFGKGVDTLSMGMSGDYKLCIEHGSNLVRIGTGIFGERETKTERN